MAKVGRRAATADDPQRDEIRQRIIDAAFVTLRDRGYAEASARAIASAGGFNQAQIFYYFGSVNALLVAALEASSLRQLRAYQEIARGATTPDDILAALRSQLAQDLGSGHVKVLAELIGASTTDPALRDKVRELFEPWMELTLATVTELSATLGLGDLLPHREVAFGVVCLFLGVQQLVTLTGDSDQSLQMLDAAQRTAGLFSAMFVSQGQTGHD